MNKMCLSCGMPLMGPEAQKAHGDYCQYCTDDKGNLLPREQVKNGIAQFLKSWSPQGNSVDFIKRAEHYMLAMPAWAE
jgi:hypothetical protein